jgi:HSP20 family protein
LEFPLAGYKKEELTIKVEDNQLQISAKRKESNENTTGIKSTTANNVARRAFSKTLIAADDLNLEAVQASFEDGLLQIKIPSRHKKKPEVKTITIK